MLCSPLDDESDSDAEEEQEKTVSMRTGFPKNPYKHTQYTLLFSQYSDNCLLSPYNT